MPRSGNPKKPRRQDKPRSVDAAPAAEAPSPEQLSAAKAYDEFPYEGYSFPLTHPERLATIASLFGLQSSAATASRVLELGCGVGGNLIPLALSMPGSTFSGYDISGVQVQRARETIDTLKLRNIAVRQGDILDIEGTSPEKFDYIICHGVFSWVPAQVQEKILEICRGRLDANGIAVISYNTYPGWHMRESVRGMMRYHARQIEDPKTQVSQSRALLDFLVKAVGAEKNPYGMYLASELKLLSQCADYYIAHEHLERWNTPLYFYEFVERATGHGLQYLGESEFNSMLVSNLSAPIAEKLSKGIRDAVQMEQYMDFIRNRMFRYTLLAHKEQRLDRNIDAGRVTRLFIGAGARPESEGDLHSHEPVKYKAFNGVEFNTKTPLLKSALRVLAASWPRSMPFEELLESATRQLNGGGAGQSNEAARRQLASGLLQLYAGNAVEFHSMPSPFVTVVSERPRASDLARWQAARGSRVTNLRHESVQVGDVERQLLVLLDGRCDRPQVIERLMQAIEQGALTLKQKGEPISDPAIRRDHVGRFYDQLLPRLGRKALLAA